MEGYEVVKDLIERGLISHSELADLTILAYQAEAIEDSRSDCDEC